MRYPKLLIPIFVTAALAIQASVVAGESKNDSSGSSLWLDYRALTPDLQKEWSESAQRIYCPGTSEILLNARNELKTAIEGFVESRVIISKSSDGEGMIMLGTLAQLKELMPKNLVDTANALKDVGYLMESVIHEGKKNTFIVSKNEAGVLYGTFHFIRLMQTGTPANPLRITSEPAVQMRMLNHWDNLNGSIERGYGGRSLWKWDELPDQTDPRYREYARFCASIGINGVVLNNVNADPRILRPDYLEKVAVLAREFRAWGIRTYLSANFAAPMHPSDTPDRMKHWGGIGNLDTADPLDPAVQEWWKKKATEIYRLIPDFGGFLVKADSEGMVGPRVYERTHLEGANMLADALAPHGGTLIWRAFVYGSSEDRALDAYLEFKPYDGEFRDNVFIQVKNGPLDFQPREPFTPLFGSMPQTHLALELQVAKEYLGHATTLAFLGSKWSEILGSDTYAKGSGSTVAKVIDGSLYGQKKTCIAGVANTGDGDEWCGSVFNQANWYAYGRLAWNPRLSADEIAEEWIKMTFECDLPTSMVIKSMMMGSYDAYVNYTMPLGLNFLVAMSDHYKPLPESRKKYHKADEGGIGFDRTSRGSNYVGQYHPELRDIFDDPAKTPLNYLLWFHHLPWNTKLSTERTLWEELVFRYDRGVSDVDEMAETWKTLEGKIAPDRHASVMSKLIQEKQFARMWRDKCINYFSEFAKPEEASSGD